MSRFRTAAVAVVAVAVVAAASVSAHHRWPVDMSTLVTVQGTVVTFQWQNPHPMIHLDVTNDAGEVERWQIGGPALNRMENNGWTRATLQGGEQITGIGYQFSNGDRIIRTERVILADGREMRLYARN